MSQSLDPFQPPREVSSPSFSTRTRPTGVTVFAILHIVFGVWGLLGLAMTIVFMFIGANIAAGPNPVFDMLQQDSLYAAFFYVTFALGGIFAVLLIVSGVGLLKMSEVARTFSLVYAVYAIVSGIVGTVVNFFLIFLPMLETAQQAQGPQLAGAIGGIIGGIIGGLVGLIYPIAILIYFLRPSVKEVFRNWSAE